MRRSSLLLKDRGSKIPSIDILFAEGIGPEGPMTRGNQRFA